MYQNGKSVVYKHELLFDTGTRIKMNAFHIVVDKYILLRAKN